jgi:Stress responsive A/B Barrel Domain.
MFVHHVFFWMKENLSPDDLKTFEKGVSTLPKIELVKFGDIGKPAGTKRPIIERSYSYSLLLVFEDKAEHDAYQTHPIHLKFIDDCSHLWGRVLIYDSESLS